MKRSNGSVAVENALLGMAIAQQVQLTEDHIRTYSELLGDLQPEILQRAITLTCKYTRTPAGMLPTASEIRAYLEQAQTELERKRKPERLRTPPAQGTQDRHECHPNVALLKAEYEKSLREREDKKIRQLLGPARSFLAALNAYEALHVLCHGDIHPVCPVCGERWAQTVANPVIIELAQRHPEETRDWSPLHKGFLICSACTKSLG